MLRRCGRGKKNAARHASRTRITAADDPERNHRARDHVRDDQQQSR